MTLDGLGPRICIMGPSNSGKSTMAAAIERKRGLPSIHLDQLHFYPGSDWQPRPDSEFIALHEEAILRPSWVMDGNYSRCLPQRLERATGVIRLETSTVISLWRYVRRSWFERERRGSLEGGGEGVKWEMIHHIAVTTRKNRTRNEAIFSGITLPKIRLATTQDLARFYQSEGLVRQK